MTGHQKLDRSISGPLSVTTAAAGMMDDDEEGETGGAQPTGLASEDVEGLSEAEVVTFCTPGLHSVDFVLLPVARRVVWAMLFHHCFACSLSVCLSVRPSAVRPSARPSVCLSVCPPVCPKS